MKRFMTLLLAMLMVLSMAAYVFRYTIGNASISPYLLPRTCLLR